MCPASIADPDARAHDWPPAPGDRLLQGRFQVLRVLGEGGMGIVVEAHDRETDARVALKTLLYLDPSAIYWLKNEFRALAGVAHANLAVLHELFEDRGRWFFTMELVHGLDFSSHVKSRPEQLRDVLVQLVRGVQAIHDQGKLHRDLKPSNVLVTDQGRVVILDFGLISDQQPGGVGQTRFGDLAGTPDFMAPEQVYGVAQRASDWYALGAMLYLALCGRLPFSGDLTQLAFLKQRADPPPPSRFASVPADLADLEALALALLRRDAQRRPRGPQILAALDAAAPPCVAPLPGPGQRVLGRERELRELQRWLVSASPGAPICATAHGPSGIGKSALVDAFARDMESEQRAVVLRGRCYERESVTYKGLDGVIDDLSRYLRRLPDAECERLLPPDTGALLQVFPVLGRVETLAARAASGQLECSPQQLRARAATALRQILHGLSVQRPLLVVVDDLQWGDGDSARMLREVLVAPDAPALLLLGTLRDDLADRCVFLRVLEAARDQLRVHRMQVRALDAAAVAQLVREIDGGLDPASAERIRRETEGHPLFVIELTHFMRSRRQPDGSCGGVSLQDAIGLRLDALAGPMRAVLELTAVASRPLARSLLVRALRGGRVQEALTHLSSGRMIQITADPDPLVCVYHDRIRETVLSGLSAHAVAAVHRRLLAALRGTRSEDFEALSWHCLGTGDAIQAAGYARRAADRAAGALAFEKAATLYRMAFQHGSRDSILRGRFAEALIQAGRGAEAAEVLLGAARESSGDLAVQLRQRAGGQLLLSGQIDSGLRTLREALFEIEIELPTSREQAQSEVLWWKQRVEQRGLDFTPRSEAQIDAGALLRLDIFWDAAFGITRVDASANALIARYLIRALEAGEPGRVLRGLVSHAMRIDGVLRAPSSELVRAIEAIAARSGDDTSHAHLCTLRGNMALVDLRPDEALPHLREAVERFERRGRRLAAESAVARHWLVMSLALAGQIQEFVDCTMRWHREASERGDLVEMTELGLQMGTAWLALDQPARAVEETAATTERWLATTRVNADALTVQSVLARAANATYLRDPGAHAILEAISAPFLGSIYSQIPTYRFYFFMLRARAALVSACCGGDPGLLERAESDARELCSLGKPWAQANAELLLGCVAATRAERERARVLLEQALAGLEGRQLNHAACARLRLGQLLGGQAGAVLESLGREQLRAQGIRNVERWAAMNAPMFPALGAA